MKRWVVWILFVVVWTVMLEMPKKEIDRLPANEWNDVSRGAVAKSIHVAAYGMLAVLSAWVPLSPRYRPLMMFLLMGHASTTELLQRVLAPYTNRTGTLEDVTFDHLGIGLGVLASWKWWTRPAAAPVAPPD